jgi:hypothetical protein
LKEANFLRLVVEQPAHFFVCFGKLQPPESIEPTARTGTAGQKTTASLPERDAAFSLNLTAVSS